jgi:hypothetical protein
MNEGRSYHTNVHPLVRVEPNITTAGKPSLGESKCKHQCSGDVAAEELSHRCSKYM